MQPFAKAHRYLPLLSLLLLIGCNQNRPASSLQTTAGQALVITPTQSPTEGDSREPDLTTTPDGKIILSWVEKISDKGYALRFAARDSNSWSEARTVAQGENWFVNWADFPSVVGLNGNALAAHWLVKSGTGTYAYDVNIATSNDGGKSWNKPIVPHSDNTKTEHGFVSLVPLPDGKVGAVWLDGRNMKNLEHEDENAPSSASMTLRYASIDLNGKVSDEAQLDGRVCECCQTSATLTPNGIVAVYRDRSETEVRDIAFVRQNNAGWEAPQPVDPDNWSISACPVNGPAISAEGRRVVVAWYTGVGDQPHAKLAFSDDAGTTFGKAIPIDDGETVGRVDTLMLPDGSALVCWMSGTAESGAIKVRRVHPDGVLGPVSVIAKTDISRSSGFPRMARLGNEVHFAWTEFGKPSHIRTAKATL